MSSTALDLRVIKLIHDHPCIWNMATPEYKCHRSRAEAWDYITKKCGFVDTKEARAFWKRLRDGLRQALTRKKDENVKKWKYQDAMSFLLPFMGGRPSHPIKIKRQPVDVSSNDDDDDEIEYLDYSSDNYPNESNENIESVKSEARSSIGDISFVKHRTSNQHNEENLVRFEVVDPLVKAQDLVNRTDNPVNRALEKFFSSMYETTNSLPERLQVRVQRQVFNAVMEAQEEYLATLESKEVSNNNSFQ